MFINSQGKYCSVLKMKINKNVLILNESKKVIFLPKLNRKP